MGTMSRLKRMSLLSAMAFVAINIWTGAPLLALWVGSRIIGKRTLTMGAVFLVLVLLVSFVSAMAVSLSWLDARYARLAGHADDETHPRIEPWLRSLRDEEDDLIRARMGRTPVEWIVTGSTVLAVIALEIWFFFFAGSPLPS
jgi:hypothetical protein